MILLVYSLSNEKNKFTNKHYPMVFGPCQYIINVLKIKKTYTEFKKTL